MRVQAWRVAFLLSGLAMFAGGPQHPSPDLRLSFQESTAVMLANPAWVPAHLGLLVSYAFLLMAVWRWGRDTPPARSTRAWQRVTLIAIALAIVEMVFHTASVIDVERLRAGVTTPILTTHLVLAALVNPLLGVAVGGLAVAAARNHVLGSLWIAWMAVLGGAMYGGASLYVVLTEDQRVSPFFAIGSSLMALWFLLVAFWPVRATRPASASLAAHAGSPPR